MEAPRRSIVRVAGELMADLVITGANVKLMGKSVRTAIADLASGNYTTHLGIAAAANTLDIAITASGVARA